MCLFCLIISFKTATISYLFLLKVHCFIHITAQIRFIGIAGNLITVVISLLGENRLQILTKKNPKLTYDTQPIGKSRFLDNLCG